jgi:hypothetical protein
LLYDDSLVVSSKETKEFALEDELPGAIILVKRASPNLEWRQYLNKIA